MLLSQKTMKLHVYILVSLFVPFVHTQIPSFGFCPEIWAMAKFDLNRFLGKWYEVERYFQFSELISRCVVTDYARSPNGRIYASSEVTNRLTGVKRVIGGSLEVVGSGNEGKLKVKYAVSPIPIELILFILDTNYRDYAIVWTCNGLGPVHTQNAWLMTRERQPSASVIQRAYGVLDRFKINRTFFVKTDQDSCAVAASDINAAHGITATSSVPEGEGGMLSNRSLIMNSRPKSEQSDRFVEKSAINTNAGDTVDISTPSSGSTIKNRQHPSTPSTVIHSTKKDNVRDQTKQQHQTSSDAPQHNPVHVNSNKPIHNNKNKNDNRKPIKTN